MAKLREEWLNEGLLLLSKFVFLPNKYKLASNIQVSCGFPSSGAFKAIGQCWYPESAGNHQLFISPTLEKPVKVLDVLTHEIVHTVAGAKAKHGNEFKHIALRVGLTGKMTATVASLALSEKLAIIASKLGPYPHKSITGLLKPKRMIAKWLRAECECGYVVRMPEAQVEQGFPVCPVCDTPLVLV